MAIKLRTGPIRKLVLPALPVRVSTMKEWEHIGTVDLLSCGEAWARTFAAA